ncbi:hypothetical protein TWF970_011468 [Orbilia oligospora]|uniref:Uncharacterized protein n=1 Tax=Orbilia oligospora TaxID=2813651 RepID=A0A7C8RCH7_ORBOL|nr:hypothetical protein TWF970_011468 [Orbilia oligospora]
MRGLKFTSITKLLFHSLLSTPFLIFFLLFDFSVAQYEIITETVFEIVPNPLTITSYLTQEGGCLILPTCLIINGSAIFPSRATTGGTNTASTTAIATYTGQPDVGFVLYGDGNLRDHYMQFDDTDGRIEFALTGAYRFVQLEVNDGGSGLLQNGLDLRELVFLRYNESVKDIYPTENADILGIVQEVRHADENELLASDFMGTWVWNTTDNQLGLERDGDRWVFYVGIGSQLRVRQIPADRDSYDVFALPENISVPSDSDFKRLSLGAGIASDFPSSIFTQSPTTTFTDSTATGSSQTTGDNTGGTGTNRSGSRTGIGTGTGTVRNPMITWSRFATGILPVFAHDGSGIRTDPIVYSNIDSRTATGSNGSANTGTATRTGTGTRTGTATGTGTGTGTGGATDGTAQIYNIITSNNLQQYCTELLSYFSPTWPTTLTTYSAYSTSTSFIPEFTSTETTYTKTEEYASRTSTAYGSITTDPAIKRRSSRGNRKRVYKTIKGKFRGRRTVPDTPAQLSGYPPDSVSAACVEAVTSPTAYIYDYTTLSTLLQFTTTFDTTQTNTKSDILTTTTGPVSTTTVPAIGNFKLVHSDLTDKSGTYYGWFINYISQAIPVKVNAAAADNKEGVTQIFYDAYNKPIVTWLKPDLFRSWVFYAAIGGTGNAAPTGDTVLNYRLENQFIYQAAGLAPFLVDYNATSYVATPDAAVVTGGKFYICDTGDAYAALGFWDLYYGPADFPSKPDYNTYKCQDTGMDAIQGENVCLTSPCS